VRCPRRVLVGGNCAEFTKNGKVVDASEWKVGIDDGLKQSAARTRRSKRKPKDRNTNLQIAPPLGAVFQIYFQQNRPSTVTHQRPAPGDQRRRK